MRYNSEHKRKLGERLLRRRQRAIKLGPERISIAANHGKGGLTHGGFYAHFSSKKSWSRQPLNECSRLWRAFLRRVEGLEPAEALAYFIDQLLYPRGEFQLRCRMAARFPHAQLTWPDSALRSGRFPFFHTDLRSYAEQFGCLFVKLGHQNAD